MFQGLPQTVHQALFRAFAHHQMVNHQVDIVNLVSVELHIELHALDDPVDTTFNESLFTDGLKQFFVVAFAAFHQRGQQSDIFA